MKSPSVTTVLGVYTREEFRNLKKRFPGIIEYAAARGTRTHAACTAYALGLPVIGLQDDCRGFLQSFQKWFDQYVTKVYFAEKRGHCGVYIYNGQLDLAVKLIDGRNVIVDLKTPAKQSRTWPAQVAAYRHLANGITGGNPRFIGGMALQLDRNGKPAKGRPYFDTQIDFDNFLHALCAYRAFKL